MGLGAPGGEREVARGSGPADLQLVGDFLDSFNASERFLGHLLLVVGTHHAAERDAALLGLEAEVAAFDVGVLLQGGEDSIVQGHVDHGS